jgi:hypothetical protein
MAGLWLRKPGNPGRRGNDSWLNSLEFGHLEQRLPASAIGEGDV